MTVSEFQQLIRNIYFEKDSRRGSESTFRWLVEEVGELARALRKQDSDGKKEEFADVFAWLVSLASIEGVDIEEACAKYAYGCPKCRSTPCACEERSASIGRRSVE
ncbi:MAG: MazG nucleotide pyrophosphohydrolase domain-containing protein [candidate division WOR-3 bacterium]